MKSKEFLKPIRKWGITPKMELQKLNDTLNTLEAVSRLHGGDYYLVDYYKEYLHFIDHSSLILAGYSKAYAQKTGLNFYSKILVKDEWIWLLTMNEKAYQILYSYTPIRRKDLVIYYDLEVKRKNGSKILINHELTPLIFCANGNMLMALCKVSISANKQSCNAYIVDKKTGDRYSFNNNIFIKSENIAISNEEKLILSLLVADFSTEEIVEQLKTSLRQYWRKKKALYAKLGAESDSAAIYRAGILGII